MLNLHEIPEFTVLNLHEIPEFFIFFGFRALFDRYVSYFMYVPSKK